VARTELGLADVIPHDYRRGSARRMERAGVPRSQAKRMGGWSTDSMYSRYARVARPDLGEAAAKVQAQLEADRRSARVPSKTASEPLRLDAPAAAGTPEATS